jgi:hypothetical protein
MCSTTGILDLPKVSSVAQTLGWRADVGPESLRGQLGRRWPESLVPSWWTAFDSNGFEILLLA